MENDLNGYEFLGDKAVMPYKIEGENGYQRVDLWGDVSKWDAIQAIMELRRLDPHKEVPDIWILGEGVVVPLVEFGDIATTAVDTIPPVFKGAPTAVVVADRLQREMVKLYRETIPAPLFKIEVFADVESAAKWVETNNPNTPQLA